MKEKTRCETKAPTKKFKKGQNPIQKKPQKAKCVCEIFRCKYRAACHQELFCSPLTLAIGAKYPGKKEDFSSSKARLCQLLSQRWKQETPAAGKRKRYLQKGPLLTHPAFPPGKEEDKIEIDRWGEAGKEKEASVPVKKGFGGSRVKLGTSSSGKFFFWIRQKGVAIYQTRLV